MKPSGPLNHFSLFWLKVKLACGISCPRKLTEGSLLKALKVNEAWYFNKALLGPEPPLACTLSFPTILLDRGSKRPGRQTHQPVGVRCPSLWDRVECLSAISSVGSAPSPTAFVFHPMISHPGRTKWFKLDWSVLRR